MASLDSFSRSYGEARDKFCKSAAAAGGDLGSFRHPDAGPDGGALSTGVAWFGPAEATRVVVLISGTHGIEGY